ncbi:MAG: TolC family protein [Bdellovibrionales bacterium]|nr:TolC family protein [Bdellovibrionales bacterium]
MFKNIFVVAVALILPLKGIANDLHLKLPEKAYEVIAKNPNALTLEQVNEMVVNDQLDLQISYEKLLQAQKKIGEARAQYFPYGIGTLVAMYILNVWNPLVLVELVTSLPSKIYNVQSEKNMSMAQQYGNKALKENIKNQVAHLYYNILKEESALKLAKMELQLLETLYKATEDKVSLGLSTEQELRSLELRMLNLRDICLKFSAYFSAEKAAFAILISKLPSEAKAIELQADDSFLNPADFTLTSEVIKLNAIDRSPEIVAADYMITAASKAKNSAAWSVLSFSGIGFGYWGKMQVAGSKIEQARLNRQQVELNLANQSYVINNSFHRTLEHFMGEQAVFNDTAMYYEAQFGRFAANDLSLDLLAETGLLYIKDFRELVAAHYDAMKKLNDLERVALGDVKSNDSVAQNIEVVFTKLNNNRYSLAIATNEDVKSVEYVFESSSLSPMTMFNRSTGYGVVLKLSQANDFSGHANVTMKNGKVITKQFSF